MSYATRADPLIACASKCLKPLIHSHPPKHMSERLALVLLELTNSRAAPEGLFCFPAMEPPTKKTHDQVVVRWLLWASSPIDYGPMLGGLG